MKVAIHQFRAGLSHYVAQAQAGKVIEITRFGKPVVKLAGIPKTGSSGLSRLVATGAVKWSGGKPMFIPPVKLVADGKPLSQLVIEDRG